MDESIQTRLKVRFVKEIDVNYPRNALHMFAENSQNRSLLHKIEAIDAISGDCKYPKSMISSAQNRKQTDTGSLSKYLELKKGTKVMKTVNIDV